MLPTTAAQLLVFEVSGVWCAFSVDAIREISHIPAITPVPGQPSLLQGFVNFHGSPVAVVSLAQILQLPEQELGLFASLIVLQAGTATIGVLSGSVEGVQSVAASELQPVPRNHSFNDCAVARFVSDGRWITLLACDRVLLDEERRRIAGLEKDVRKRLEDLAIPNPAQS